MSAFSLEHSCYWNRTHHWQLNGAQIEQFLKEIERLDWEVTGSQDIAAHYRQSLRNTFLARMIADPEYTLAGGWGVLEYQELIEKALQLTPENLEAAASEWKWFSDTFFINQGRPIPEWPEYVQIQQRLGLFDWYYDSENPKIETRLRKEVRQRLKYTFYVLSQTYPNWKWAARMHCYFTAALSQTYILPSGEYSCL